MSDRSILGRVMLAFEGDTLPAWVATRLRAAPAAGMTVFRYHNVRTPGQVRELMEAVQRAGRVGPGGSSSSSSSPVTPLLIGADLEGGQLQPLGDTVTAFPGNMALGAVGDASLAERVGFALGQEARAMGINVVYAPVMDVASNPDNLAIGIRSFGDDPAVVGSLGAAMVAGLQRAGVAATIKHFPGLGDAAADTHHGGAVVATGRDRLDAVELPPFRAGIAAGARLVMSSHVAVPALTGDPTLPGTLSRAVMTDLLRGEFGFDGVTISDALDMAALDQGAAQRAQMVAAANAGVDLFLCAADRSKLERIEAALVDGVVGDAIDAPSSAAALARIHALRSWVGEASADVGLEVVGGAEHRALEAEVAARALTLVTDLARWRPLDLPRDATIAAIMPTPTDLTPADTSSTLRPGLAAALRAHHGSVEEIVVSPSPTDAEIAAVRARVATADAVVVGTIDAVHQPGQVELVRALVEAGSGDRRLIAVALRTPWDVSTYPAGVPAICTYSIHPASLAALADALFGGTGFPGRLPVQVLGGHHAGVPR